tara:strand:+ start:1555 stop:2067 length:513 start_codon:yes stop_codon:yes gene_type:complete
MSFQKAHNVSNQLGEVLISTPLIDTTSMGTSVYNYEPSTAVAGKNYRVLEVGYTVIVVGTNATVDTNFADVGIQGDTNSFVDACDLPKGSDAPVGTTISTNSSPSGINCDFRPISTDPTPGAVGYTNIDQDGVPRLYSGQLLLARGAGNVTNGPKVVFFARLAPIVEYKD